MHAHLVGTHMQSTMFLSADVHQPTCSSLTTNRNDLGGIIIIELYQHTICMLVRYTHMHRSIAVQSNWQDGVCLSLGNEG